VALSFFVLVSCQPVPKPVELTVGGYDVTVETSGGHAFGPAALEEIVQGFSGRITELDPERGDILGKLNQTVPGEIIPCGDTLDTLDELLEDTRSCYGAFDPTLQILWDVYDFGSGGRWVAGGRWVDDAELADALQWVDYHQVEIDRGGILRKNDTVRLGFGPSLPGAIADWLLGEISDGTSSGMITVDQCTAVWGNRDNYTLDFIYPLESQIKDIQLTVGHLKIQPGDCVAALDDDEGYFFAHGQRFHMILSPITGRPEQWVRAAVVISRKSCLQASVYAYALMAMGPDRGKEFLEEADNIEGLILTRNFEVIASSGLADRFWR
jgi:thiamine biosynthesis lipoprotein